MDHSRFAVGTRYKYNGEIFIVRELLLDGKLSVENQSLGGLVVTTQDELSTAWAQGKIFFEARSPKPTRNTECVEIDDTLLDLVVVDLKNHLPTGRPTITYAIDAYSGMPYAFHIEFECRR